MGDSGMGCVTGHDPVTSAFTEQRSDHLSYTHHTGRVDRFRPCGLRIGNAALWLTELLPVVRVVGFAPTASCLEDRRSAE